MINMNEVLGKVPILGICYGAQLYAHLHGGKVSKTVAREYGRANLLNIINNELLKGIPINSKVWMSHGDTIKELPENCEIICTTTNIPIAAYIDKVSQFLEFNFTPKFIILSMGKFYYTIL